MKDGNRSTEGLREIEIEIEIEIVMV